MSEQVEFSISRHAVRRMMCRGVSLTQMDRVLSHPDKMEPDPIDPDLMHAIKRFHRPSGSDVLRVIYNSAVTPWRVVTVYWDRKAGRIR